jgi:hypothetical protein
MTVAFLDRSAPTPRITYCFDVGDIHFHEYYYSFVLIMQQETACRHQTRQHLVVWLLSLRWLQFLHENRDRLLTPFTADKNQIVEGESRKMLEAEKNV